jgi:hypothetical protein
MKPLPFNCRFHHLGLAVRAPEKAVALLEAQGYAAGEPVFDPLQGVHLIWCTHDTMPAVEIIYQTAAGGPLDAVLAGKSEAIYHVCYAVEDAGGAIESLTAKGLRVICVSPEKPSTLFAGQSVSFHYVGGFGLIELVNPTKQLQVAANS